MDDRDFYSLLSDRRSSRKDGDELLSILKTSGAVGDIAKKGLDMAAKNKIPLLGAAIGTATATALQYLDNKPKKDGSPSSQRRSAEGGLTASEALRKNQKEQGKEPTFGDDMNHEKAKFRASASQVMEKHPVRGALLAAPMGAAAGYGLGALAKKVIGG